MRKRRGWGRTIDNIMMNIVTHKKGRGKLLFILYKGSTRKRVRNLRLDER